MAKTFWMLGSSDLDNICHGRSDCFPYCQFTDV